MVELSNANITIKSVGTLTIEALNVTINGRPVVPTTSPSMRLRNMESCSKD